MTYDLFLNAELGRRREFRWRDEEREGIVTNYYAQSNTCHSSAVTSFYSEMPIITLRQAQGKNHHPSIRQLADSGQASAHKSRHLFLLMNTHHQIIKLPNYQIKSSHTFLLRHHTCNLPLVTCHSSEDTSFYSGTPIIIKLSNYQINSTQTPLWFRSVF